MPATIKAIETVYQGFLFRSRTEARWAVLFDTLGVRWAYELEGFNLTAKARDLLVLYAQSKIATLTKKGNRLEHWRYPDGSPAWYTSIVTLYRG